MSLTEYGITRCSQIRNAPCKRHTTVSRISIEHPTRPDPVRLFSLCIAYGPSLTPPCSSGTAVAEHSLDSCQHCSATCPRFCPARWSHLTARCAHSRRQPPGTEALIPVKLRRRSGVCVREGWELVEWYACPCQSTFVNPSRARKYLTVGHVSLGLVCSEAVAGHRAPDPYDLYTLVAILRKYVPTKEPVNSKWRSSPLCR